MCGIWGLLSTNKIELNQNILFDKFNQIKSRGPDRTIWISNSNYIIGFHRLAIMDTTIQGDQPFSHSYYYTNGLGEKILRTTYVVVNGEIYNHKELKSSTEVIDILSKINYSFKSNSDCEVILPMFLREFNELDELSNSNKSIGPDINNNNKDNKENQGFSNIITKLSGEFAFAIFDIHSNTETNSTKYNLWTGRDRFGIRPLFYSKIDENTVVFGSEVKSLIGINNNKVEVHDPRSWINWSGKTGQPLEYKYKLYYAVGNLPVVLKPDLTDVYRMIRTKLTEAVKVRLESDREVGCLLSGGLDSSLVAAIAAKELAFYGKKLRTFSIGMENSPDVYFAKIVANHIGSIHTNIEIPEEQWINAISEVIRVSETYDITTIRATTGQYLVSRWISLNTNIKVLLIGDGSDEATGGYLYFHKAPNRHDFHFETIRLLHYIHYFDVLRADRGVASNGLEARVPYLDHNFINFYFQIDLELKTPRPHTLSNGKTFVFEKYLLRKAWDKTNLLPECVLWRKKEAFSDGVSSQSKSWYQIVQEKAESIYTDNDLELAQEHYKSISSIIPHTKEALFYHKIFDSYYPNQYHLCPYYWLPKWIDGVSDPSARTLKVYSELEVESEQNVSK